MNEYFLGLIVFAFVGAIVLSLVPSGAGRGYVKLLCGLCSVCCIAFPIFELVELGGNEFDYIVNMFDSEEAIKNADEIYNKALNTATVENAENSLKNDIIKGVSAKYDDIDVKIILSEAGDEFYISDIVVYLYSGAYTVNPKSIREICVSKLGKECKIIYK